MQIEIHHLDSSLFPNIPCFSSDIYRRLFMATRLQTVISIPLCCATFIRSSFLSITLISVLCNGFLESCLPKLKSFTDVVMSRLLINLSIQVLCAYAFDFWCAHQSSLHWAEGKGIVLPCFYFFITLLMWNDHFSQLNVKWQSLCR